MLAVEDERWNPGTDNEGRHDFGWSDDEWMMMDEMDGQDGGRASWSRCGVI